MREYLHLGRLSQSPISRQEVPGAAMKPCVLPRQVTQRVKRIHRQEGLICTHVRCELGVPPKSIYSQDTSLHPKSYHRTWYRQTISKHLAFCIEIDTGFLTVIHKYALAPVTFVPCYFVLDPLAA